MLYLVIFITITIPIQQALHSYFNKDYQLTTTDYINIAIYISPFAGAFIGFSGFLLLAIYKDPQMRPKLHADALICMAFNVTFGLPLNYGHGNPLWTFCNEISTNIIVMIINIFISFIVTAIICLIIPIMTISGRYNEQETIRHLSSLIQTLTIFVTSIFYFIYFNQYGSSSLIIVLSAMFYSFVAIIYYLHIVPLPYNATSRSKIFWVIFEITTLMTMFTIVFHVQYSSLTLSVMLVYFVLNVPFSKLFLSDYYRQTVTWDRFWTYFATEGTEKYSYKDKVYCLLHDELHENAQEIAVSPTESTYLLSKDG